MSDNKVYFNQANYSSNFSEFLGQFNQDMNNYLKDHQEYEVNKIADILNNEFCNYISNNHPDAKIILIPQFNQSTHTVEMNMDPQNIEGFNLMKETLGEQFNDYVWDDKTNKMLRYRSMMTVLNSKQVANLKSLLNVVSINEDQVLQIKTVDKLEKGIKSYLYIDGVFIKDLDSE